jgi:hypothetical protein
MELIQAALVVLGTASDVVDLAEILGYPVPTWIKPGVLGSLLILAGIARLLTL